MIQSTDQLRMDAADQALFPTAYSEILRRMEHIQPVKYGKTRNFIDGAVTYLSPYISRGVISTRQVMDHLKDRGINPYSIEKFIQELAWRDYWQQVWIAKGNEINEDLRHPQADVTNNQIAASIVNAQTGIEAIDAAIQTFYQTGYLHNHVRMYIASIACNIGKSHWKTPAQWMYYHLLDADWASNALSWQWVAGSNSHKKYYANQGNINKYCYTDQQNTFLDVPYEALVQMPVPEELRNTINPALDVDLPESNVGSIDPEIPTLIYNFYNLDPNWRKDQRVNRILLLEPSHFEAYPVSKKTLDFIIDLSENIDGIQVYSGTLSALVESYGITDIIYKEHPLNRHYQGKMDSRDWMFDVKGYFRSFFAFWKKCRKEL